MKIIVEASAYLVILSFICLISLDFIAVNKSVSKGSELQQYKRCNPDKWHKL